MEARLGKAKASISTGSSGNIIEIDKTGTELGSQFSAFNAGPPVVSGDYVLFSMDASLNYFFVGSIECEEAENLCGCDVEPTDGNSVEMYLMCGIYQNYRIEANIIYGGTFDGGAACYWNLEFICSEEITLGETGICDCFAGSGCSYYLDAESNPVYLEDWVNAIQIEWYAPDEWVISNHLPWGYPPPACVSSFSDSISVVCDTGYPKFTHDIGPSILTIIST